MEIKTNLVSVIIPCYNGEKVIHCILDSLLEQTYKNFEVIFINDGSTDDTESVVKKYIPCFQDQSIVFNYIRQVNKGLGGAINTGLKHVSGEFFVWPDADDFLTPDSIEKRLKVLRDNPQVPLITSNAYVMEESEYDKSSKLLIPESADMNSSHLFEDYVFTKGWVVFCSGTHMVRTLMFEEANHGMSIFEARRGQNWQLLLPILYKYNSRIWLSEPLYYYVVSQNSMSRDFDFESYMARSREHFEILSKTISHIVTNTEERDQLMMQIKHHYICKDSIICLRNKKIKMLLGNLYNNRNEYPIVKHLLQIFNKKIAY